MKKKIFGLFTTMFLVLMAFAFIGVAMASIGGSAPAASMACMAGPDCDSVAGVVAIMKDDTMIKFDLPAPGNFEKGSAISSVACSGKNHPGHVLAALEWPEQPGGSPLAFAINLSAPGFVQLE